MAKHYQPSAVLRDNAKGFLNGKYGPAIGTTLIYAGLNAVVTNLVNQISTGLSVVLVNAGASGTAASVILIVLELLLSGVCTVSLSVLMVGLSYYYLKLGSGHMPAVSDIFYGYREDFARSFAASFYVNIILIVSFAPGMVAMGIYTNTRKVNYLYTALILYIIGLVVYIFFDISLKITYYILADFPEYTAKEAVIAAWKKMSGHRGRLFSLMVSFIPYYLLGVLSFGIGLLWLFPLMQESYVQFYLDLMNPKETSGEWERTV